MKSIGLSALRGTALVMLSCALAGCAAAEVPEPPVPPVLAVASPPAPLPAAVPKPVARVLSQFNDAEETELHAVTRPRVTPEFVRDVHAAHLEARKAVTTLEQQKLRPSSAVLGHAQAAVSKLGAVLSAAPGDEP